MRTTLVLTVNDQLSEFILNQPGLVDPSALVNQLLHREMARLGKGQPAVERNAESDELSVALEKALDENTHAAD